MEPTIGSGCVSRYSLSLCASFSRSVLSTLTCTLAGWIGVDVDGGAGCTGEWGPTDAAAAKASDGIGGSEFANRSGEDLRRARVVAHSGS